MRTFKAVNSLGSEFNLMRRDAFFYTPNGLGVAFANTFARVGRAFVATKKEISQGQISGKMIFEGYSQYTEFRNFITNQPLQLVYKVGSSAYTIKVMPNEISKGEINYKTRRLECPIVFDCLTLWFKDQLAYRDVPSVSGGKIYSYDYDYSYSGSAQNLIRIENSSSLEGAGILTLFGQLVNPFWRLIENGKTVAQGEITETIPAGHKLVINSIDDELEVAEYTDGNEFVRNLYQYTNFAMSTFFKVPSGTSTIAFGESGNSAIESVYELREYYETV